MIPFEIKTLPFYTNNPDSGMTQHTDSRVVDQLIDYQDSWYDLKYRIEVTYNRWYHPKTDQSPKEDYTEVQSFQIELIRVQPQVSDREFRRLQSYLDENLKVE